MSDSPAADGRLPTVIVRPARTGDLEAYGAQVGKTIVTPTVIAWVGEYEDGRIIGVGGVAIIGGHYRGFVDLLPEARAYKVLIALSALRFFRAMRKAGVRHVYAALDEGEPGAGRFAEALGFRPDQRSGGELHRWNGVD